MRKSITPKGFQLYDHPRAKKKGGGVAVICRSSLKCQEQKLPSMSSCEMLELLINARTDMLRLAVLYRPPSSSKTGMPVSTFLDEFQTYIDSRVTMSGKLIVLGDFNFHYEKSNQPDTKKLHDLIFSLNLKQHVSETTHIHGHQLDLVVSREDEISIQSIEVHPPTISDHSLISFEVKGKVGKSSKKIISFRKIDSIDLSEFKEDVAACSFVTSPAHDVVSLSKQYEEDLRRILDQHAPLVEKEVTDRNDSPWFTDDCKLRKNIKRKAERKFRKSKLAIDFHILTQAVIDYKESCFMAKTNYFQNKIQKCQGNQKDLFQIVNNLLHRNKDTRLPSYTDPATLANNFALFFKSKIDKIKKDFSESIPQDSHVDDIETLTELKEVSQKDVRKLIQETNNKCCHLDPIPTSLLKTSLDILLPSITLMINASITESKFPPTWKTATVTPLLKKPTADVEDMSNYRPVSNLAYMSKLAEKVVLQQIDNHLTTQSLHQPNQSAYRKNHSTETALVKIQNDILLEMDQKKCVLLVLLDMSAAFDTVDHSILLTRLKCDFGIANSASSLLQSYFTGRTQRVNVSNSLSDPVSLNCGMPQGSIIGPKGYPIYVSPIFNIASKHSINIHMYADDTQLYLSFYPTDWAVAKITMETCIHEIRDWLKCNHLKLNDKKTEVMIIGKEHWKSKIVGNLNLVIGDEEIQPSLCVKNLGAYLDAELTMQDQIRNVSKSCYASLHSIGRIRKYLDQESVQTLVHAFITCKVDNLNSLLPCVSDHSRSINKLQMILNSSARLIFKLKKFDSISDVLKELHWLPVEARIRYKVLLLTYKSLNGSGPSYLVDMLKFKNFRRSTRAANDCLILEKPKTNLVTVGDKSFSFYAVELWNSLPLELRSCSSIHSFKRNLKTFLFKQFYPQ